jgi:hypothetical protein
MREAGDRFSTTEEGSVVADLLRAILLFIPLVRSGDTKARRRTVEQKARILAEASALSGEPPFAYLDREGVGLADYERWRIALQEDGRESAAVTKRIRELERELARKEKALAEAAALLG